jgi:glycosyltransferase involved in cell wall biosynthesis
MTREDVGITVVIDHPAQHFTRAFQLLAAEPGLRVHVCYAATPEGGFDPGFARPVAWDVDLLGGYPWSAPGSGRIAPWLARELRARKPDMVLCYGWASPIARAAIAYCLLTGTPLLMYGDTTWQHSSSGRHRMSRSAALNVLLRRCAGAVSTGTFNREFYIQHGMHPRRIWPGVCPADTDLFSAARTWRQDISAGDELRIGFAGKLIDRKGPDELIRAAALLAPSPAWSVTLVGDGPLLPALQALAVGLGLANRVTFRGFANAAEMPKLLAAFDVVVVPSRLDMRALVTIEAMAAGAAVVVSDATAVWGPGDLIEERATGLVYPSGEPTALAGQLQCLLDDPALLGRLQRDGAERAEGYGPAAFARTTADAIRLCLADRRRLKP